MATPKTRFERIVPRRPSSTKSARQAQAALQVQAMTVDECVKSHTAFTSLTELVTECLRPGNTYRPSLYTKAHGTSLDAFKRAGMATRIADAFDAAMTLAGSPKKAYRGS